VLTVLKREKPRRGEPVAAVEDAIDQPAAEPLADELANLEDTFFREASDSDPTETNGHSYQ
jgi:hypothetical protein